MSAPNNELEFLRRANSPSQLEHSIVTNPEDMSYADIAKKGPQQAPEDVRDIAPCVSSPSC